MLRRLAAAASGEAGPLFEQREVKRTCYIVVGADKGLAGAFSSNINKAMAAIVAEKGRDAVTFLVTGRKPVEYLKRLRITPAGKWSGFSDKPQYHHAQTVMHEAVKRFKEEYLFAPDSNQVLTSLVPTYLEAFVYNSLLQSAASELGARMTAMTSATDNAGELIDRLTVHYNKVRQAGITNELTEIVSGANALQ